MKPLEFGKISSAQLHQSVDAREDGYVAVTYLLLHDLHKRIHCAFIMGKAWVAPLKSITIHYHHRSYEQNGQVVEEGAENDITGVSFLG